MPIQLCDTIAYRVIYSNTFELSCWNAIWPVKWADPIADLLDRRCSEPGRRASLAASRGDAAEERLQRIRGDALRQELALLDTDDDGEQEVTDAA